MTFGKFDRDAQLPDRLQSRIDAWQDNPPESQFQAYGPLNAYLQGHKFETDKFLVKPQALLREEDAGAEEQDGDDDDDDAGNRSYDSQGVGVTKVRKHPDFTICQFWGADVNSNKRPDVIRVVFEVASNERDKQEVVLQVLENLDFVGERFHDRILGVAMVKNEVCLFRELEPGSASAFGSLYGWISLFDPRFVQELNSIHDFSRQTDRTTWG